MATYVIRSDDGYMGVESGRHVFGFDSASCKHFISLAEAEALAKKFAEDCHEILGCDYAINVECVDGAYNPTKYGF